MNAIVHLVHICFAGVMKGIVLNSRHMIICILKLHVKVKTKRQNSIQTERKVVGKIETNKKN